MTAVLLADIAVVATLALMVLAPLIQMGGPDFVEGEE